MQNEEYRFLNSKIKVTNSKSAFTKYLMIIGSTFSILILIFSFIASVKIYSNRNYDKIPGRMSQDELETIVRERTAEISQINNRLYKELKKQVETDAVLRQREHDYRILFEQAHDAIIIFEPESEIILEVNHRACEVYQIPHKHFIGISLKSLSKNVLKGEMHLSQTLKNGYKLNFQTVHYRKDGTEMLMEINASVINYKGKTAILSINRDVTERILSLIPLPGSEQ
jgi:PAS domain S-box-containing protein